VSTEISSYMPSERQQVYEAWQDANARAAALIRESATEAPKGLLLAQIQAEEAKAASLVVRYRRLTDSETGVDARRLATS